ncbi:AbrB/MazE/SpoVT family DNA-binding domain-containing protein [Sansalvadorimonas verongulae]|uniref:AbrB/MazE/SpoVT family DNA-binding domain-containing protein n=1 Tax=Sansalvadorimonas verongulae TaxID=2172824 RepID=UPI0012BBB15E|nr:AbrB/MazE/SpoVT family DNA-binding domain-containing protein [Sansalvadorimonas verongulae]MTI11847.1 AbrB/MazE/SpoVT family DNA-binding domain-containing protein [Sansalvadorimonas verongulae]
MMKVGQDMRVTLPVWLCKELDIKPGDDLECLIVDAHLTLRKRNSTKVQTSLRKQLAGFPVDLSSEDKQWLAEHPKGKEEI